MYRPTLILFLGPLLTLYGCSSFYRNSESIDQKMSRYSVSYEKINPVPELEVYGKDLPSKKRSPASQSETTYSKHSNKQLYFRSLFNQYNTFLGYGEGEYLKSCPSFHNTYLSMVDQKKIKKLPQRSTPKNHYSPHWVNSQQSQQLASLYPELGLPLTESEVYPRVVESLEESRTPQVELIQRALHLHIKKTYRELTELCETGNSDNYFVYENLMTHIQKLNHFSSQQKNLELLLKTTIFSNWTLLTSLEAQTTTPSRIPASLKDKSLQIEITQRFKARWANDYYRSILKRRGGVSKK